MYNSTFYIRDLAVRCQSIYSKILINGTHKREWNSAVDEHMDGDIVDTRAAWHGSALLVRPDCLSQSLELLQKSVRDADEPAHRKFWGILTELNQLALMGRLSLFVTGRVCGKDCIFYASPAYWCCNIWAHKPMVRILFCSFCSFHTLEDNNLKLRSYLLLSTLALSLM